MSRFQQLLSKPHVSIEERRQKLLRWLDAVFTDNKYDAAIRSRHAKTCDWIFQRPQYRDWESPNTKKSKLLWIHGPPGFGKTVLCSSLIERLIRSRPKQVAYFFCASENEATREPYAILKSWIAQLVALNDDSVHAAEKVYQDQEVRAPTFTELWLLFTSISKRIPQSTFVLDGFDECTQVHSTAGFRTTDGRAKFLQELVKAMAQTNTQVVMVSRDLSDIRSGISNDSFDMTSTMLYEYAMTAADTSEDVSCFAASMVDSKLPNKSKALRQNIAEEATRKCEGMFLWLHLLRDELHPGESAKELRRTVSEMPAGIEQAYEKDLERITMLKKDKKDRAIAILRWILFAVRPLTVHELCEALAHTFNDKEDTYVSEDDLPECWLESYVDEDYVNDVVRRPCGSLVEIRGNSLGNPLHLQTVHFVHFSVKEYLLRPTADGGPATESLCFANSSSEHNNLASLCLQYLCYDVFGVVMAQDGMALKQTIRMYPFLTYAARSWYKHAYHHQSISEVVVRHANKLFSPVRSNWIVSCQVFEAKLHDTDHSNSDSSKVRMKHKVVSTEDIPKPRAGDGDDKKQIINSTESEGQQQTSAAGLPSKVSNPVYYAALLGLTDIIKALYTQGLDCNEIGGRYGFPLQAAIVTGQHAAVKTLLELGADVKAKGGEYGYAIFAAAALGLEATFQLLIKAGAEVEVLNIDGITCLHMASSKGAIAIVKRLLDSQMDVDILSTYGETPLHFACSTGCEEVVRLLLHHGANANMETNTGVTPLLKAISGDHKEVVKVLLTIGVSDVFVSVDDNGSNISCLHLAAVRKNEEIVQLLLTHGADPNAEIDNNWTALHFAAHSGSTGIAKLLLVNGANVNQQGKGGPPLHRAVVSEQEVVARLLLHYGANVNAKNSDSVTSLHQAVYHPTRLPLARLLLDKGADARIADDSGNTALDWAGEQGHQEAILLLLEYGAGSDEVMSRSKFATGHATSNLRVMKRDLHKAAFYGLETDLMHLLESTPFPDLQGALDSSLLMAAAGAPQTTNVLLLDRGANVKWKAVDGRTALHQAATRGSRDISQLLLDHGAEVDAEDVNGFMAIHLAARRGLLSLTTVELLTQQSGAFGKTSSDCFTQLGATPFDKASETHLPSKTRDKTNEQTLFGKWLGTCTLSSDGQEESTEFNIPIRYAKSPATERILEGQGEDLSDVFEIRGQLLGENSVCFVQLYDTYGWWHHGQIDWNTNTITGHWGRSCHFRCGTFTITRQN